MDSSFNIIIFLRCTYQKKAKKAKKAKKLYPTSIGSTAVKAYSCKIRNFRFGITVHISLQKGDYYLHFILI